MPQLGGRISWWEGGFKRRFQPCALNPYPVARARIRAERCPAQGTSALRREQAGRGTERRPGGRRAGACPLQRIRALRHRLVPRKGRPIAGGRRGGSGADSGRHPCGRGRGRAERRRCCAPAGGPSPVERGLPQIVIRPGLSQVVPSGAQGRTRAARRFPRQRSPASGIGKGRGLLGKGRGRAARYSACGAPSPRRRRRNHSGGRTGRPSRLAQACWVMPSASRVLRSASVTLYTKVSEARPTSAIPART